MLEVTNLIHGAVLNRHDGTESAEKLVTEVTGLARCGDLVTVNGRVARREGEAFRAPLELREKFNDVVVRAAGDRGERELRLRVLWDKQSFRRCNFFIDDNIFFLSEIAKNRPASLFDHFYLKTLKRLHERYGLKVTLNLFYRNDHFPFVLKDFPADYRSEWRDSAEWLRLSFHAFSEFPDRPYQNATAEKLGADYDLLRDEIVRFAGEESFIRPVVIHWAMAQPPAIAELKKRGVNFLSGGYLNTRTRIGESVGSIPTTDIGYFQSLENSLYLRQKRVRYDFRHDMLFGIADAVCNLDPVAELRRQLQSLCADPGNDLIGLATHEQYSFPFYANYLADHAERIGECVRMASEAGCAFVFYSEGMMGNTAWER